MEAVKQILKQPLLKNEGKELIFENQSAKLHFSIGTTDHDHDANKGEYSNEKKLVHEHQIGQLKFGISIADDSKTGEERNKEISHHQQHDIGVIEEITKNKILLPSPADSSLTNTTTTTSSSSDSSSLSYVNSPSEEPVGIALSASNEVKEIYLKKIYVVPANHEFYCPKCNVCIEKVLFCRTRDEIDVTPGIEEEVGPAGGGGDGSLDYPVRCSACFTFLIQKGKEWIINLVPSARGPSREPPIARSGKGWEIVKSFVYGGLAELLASLSVVTSAASADSTTINIVALAIANLIGGLILLVHNLRDLKATQPIEQDNENRATLDKYYELLGNRDHFYLHAFVAIISFLIFGLLPPIVYGFSFRESDDKDLKLIALAVASLIGITVLAIAKAYAMRSNNNFMATFKTVFYYVFSGVLASLITYVAGSLVKRLVEQLGWFDPGSNASFSISKTSNENPALDFY